MANVLLKGTQIAAQAIGLLQRELVLPRLVTRYGATDFAGQKGETVTVRVPAVLTAREYEWRTRTNPIVLDELEERSVTVTLNKHPYSAVAVTDEELSLDITSWGTQVMQPQVRAVAEKLESYIVDAITGAPYRADMIVTGATPAGTDGISDGQAYRVATKARKALNKKNVPIANRRLLLGADVEELFLNDKRFVEVDKSGSDDALREAFLGRIAGFDTYLSNSIPAGDAYAFHATAFAFGNVAPVVPAGAADGAMADLEGLAMRWIRDYDVNFARDRSFVSAFAGAAATKDGDLPDATISNKARAGTLVTLTTAAAHGFTVGETVTVTSDDPVINGTFTIVGTPSATTFTYNTATSGAIASAAATGTASIAGTLVRAVKVIFTETA